LILFFTSTLQNHDKEKIRMQLTPAIKGQLTKALHKQWANRQYLIWELRSIFQKAMPAEQAKHATKQFLTQHAV
jgi:hypothetical protein